MRSWLNSNWLELLITVLIVIIEVAMVTPWLVVLVVASGREGIDPLVPVGLGVIGLASFWSARELLERQWDLAAMRMVSLGVWLAAIIIWFGAISGAGLAAPLEFIDQLFGFEALALGLVFLGALAWWRGIWLAASEEVFYSEFVRGLVMRTIASHVLVLVLAAFLWDEVSSAVLSIAAVMVPLGLAASLVASTAVQVRTVRLNVSAGEEQREVGTGWLGAGAGITASILIVAAVVAGTTGREAWQIITWPISMLLRGVDFLVYWALYGLAFTVFFLLYPVFWLFDRLADPDQELPGDEEIGGPLEPAEQTERAFDLIPEPVIQVLQWAVLIAVIAVLVWLALRQFRRLRQAGERDDEDEVRESVMSKDALLNDLGGMLRGLRPNWRRGGTRFSLRRAPESVREAYLFTLVHAGRQGLPREQHESAVQYSSRLSATSPDVVEPVDDLTERYLRARYAERTSDEDIEISREDWEKIRERLRTQPSE